MKGKRDRKREGKRREGNSLLNKISAKVRIPGSKQFIIKAEYLINHKFNLSRVSSSVRLLKLID